MATDASELAQRVRLARRGVDRDAGEALAMATRGKHLQEEVSKLKAQVSLLEQVSGLLTSIGEERQHLAQLRVETLVTQALQAVFGEDISFHMLQSVKAKAAQVDFVVRSRLVDGTLVDTPIMDARGGGLAAVVGFLLRLVVLLLSPTKQAPVLFLDESFAMLSQEFQPLLADWLAQLTARTNVQVVMVTHSDVFTEAADKAYRFTTLGGETKVAQVR